MPSRRELDQSDPARLSLLTSAQLSEYLNIPAEQLSKWRQRREGPPYYRITRQHVRYRLSEVEAWLEAKRVTG